MSVRYIKSQIDKHKVISFDIFDTLLVRPYMKPVDVFYHLERTDRVEGFADARIEAELRAREIHSDKQEITLDEIYEQLDPIYGPMKQREIEFETQILQPNPEMKQVFDYALRQGKKVIITSDMYLPQEMINDILIQKGFSGFEKLYLSNTHRLVKWTSDLFRKVLNDLSLKPSDMLHIGDNKISDFKQPKKLGISCILYRTIARQFIKSNEYLYDLWIKNTNSWDISVILGVLAIRWKKIQMGLAESDYWNGLGYFYGGPAVYAYMRYLKDIVDKNDISQVLFVARDGYSLQKSFNMMAPDIQNAYIYAPRFFNLVTGLAFKNDQQALDIIHYYADKDDAVNRLIQNETVDTASAAAFINRHRSVFEQAAARQIAQYQKYIQSFIDIQKQTVLVDTVTVGFSAQRLLEHALPNAKLSGYYWSVIYSAEAAQHRYFRFDENKIYDFSPFTKNWNFMEFIMSAPELPIQGLKDNRPVYMKNPSPYELYRKNLYPDLSAGMTDFTADMVTYFKDRVPNLSFKAIVSWLNYFFDHLTMNDRRYLSKIYFASDAAHSKYSPLFKTQTSFGYLVNKIKRLTRGRAHSWKHIRRPALKTLKKIAAGKNKPVEQGEFYAQMNPEIDAVLKGLGHFSFCPNTGNLGDFLIAQGEYKLFEKQHYDYEIYNRTRIGDPDQPENFVYGGGGVFVSYWNYKPFLNVFKNKQVKKIVILPASFHECDDLVACLDERFTIFCREQNSYHYLKSAKTRATIYLADDMALGLTDQTLKQNLTAIGSESAQAFLADNDFKRKMKLIYSELYVPYQRVVNKMKPLLDPSDGMKIGYFLRTDDEASKDQTKIRIDKTFDLSVCAAGVCSDIAMVNILSKLFLSAVNTVDVVVTDRLHVAISGAILGKPVLMIDNSYKKLSGVYENSMRRFPAVRLVTTDELPEALQNMSEVQSADHKMLKQMDMNFTDFITAYIGSYPNGVKQIMNIFWGD